MPFPSDGVNPVIPRMLTAAQTQNLMLEKAPSFESFTGLGVRATVADQDILIGNALRLRFLSSPMHEMRVGPDAIHNTYNACYKQASSQNH